MARRNPLKGGFLQATGYLDEHITQEEVPLYRAHLSWIPVFVHQIPFMLLGGVIGGVVWGVQDNFLLGIAIYIAAFVIGILAQIPQVYKNIATDILITNRGIHSKRKLFAIEDDRFTEHIYINDVKLDYHGIFQRLFEYGTITVPSVNGEDEYYFKNLAKPQTFKQARSVIKSKYGSGQLPFQAAQGAGGGAGFSQAQMAQMMTMMGGMMGAGSTPQETEPSYDMEHPPTRQDNGAGKGRRRNRKK